MGEKVFLLKSFFLKKEIQWSPNNTREKKHKLTFFLHFLMFLITVSGVTGSASSRRCGIHGFNSRPKSRHS